MDSRDAISVLSTMSGIQKVTIARTRDDDRVFVHKSDGVIETFVFESIDDAIEFRNSVQERIEAA